MTMTDAPSPPPPPPVTPPPGHEPAPGPGPDAGGGVRLLRRSASDRVVGGVAGGLGRTFDVDPVLFRVLFATTALFGGLGLVAYALGWALIPEEGTARPVADRLVAELRRRKIPFWVVVVGAALVLWTAVSTAWEPWGSIPVVAVVALIAVALSRRAPQAPVGHPAATDAPAEVDPDATTVGLLTPPVAGPAGLAPTGPAPWREDLRTWRAESRQAARERRRRKAPVAWASFGVLLATLGVLGLIDASRGIPVVSYGWAALVVSCGALVVGGILRRTPWGMVVWIPLAIATVITFSGTDASLRDGSGDRLVAPQRAAALAPTHHIAFGRTTLDLTALDGETVRGRTVDVRVAAGVAHLVLPSDLPVTVHAHVRFGSITTDGSSVQAEGIGLTRDIVQRGSGGSPLVIDVDVAAGDVQIDHVA